MPLNETVVLGGQRYAIRHIGPAASVWPGQTGLLATQATLLATPLAARPLPSNPLPSSPDLVQAQVTLRLGDAGECVLTFPNTEASDGMLWRQRFSTAGHVQFFEVYLDGLLEQVCVIDQVTVDQQSVTVHGSDAFFLLKKAYERDWTVIQSPRDVIERASQVWLPIVADNFPAGSLSAQWNVVQNNGGTVTVGNSGGCVLAVPAGGSGSNQYTQAPGTAVNVNNGGAFPWLNPGNVTAADGQYATVTNITSLGNRSQILRVTGFGFNIPAGSTITGIQVQIQRYASKSATDQVLSALKASAEVGTNKASGTSWPHTQATATYGGSADLWGATWTPSDINGSGFGIDLIVNCGGQSTVYVDNVQITVYFTGSSGNPQAQIRSRTAALAATGAWQASAYVQNAVLGSQDAIVLQVTESSGDIYALNFFGSTSNPTFTLNGTTYAQLTGLSAVSSGLLLESDGEWVYAFVNGQLVGAIRRAHATTTTLQATIALNVLTVGQAATATVTGALAEATQPLLMAGTDKGDYVLPGTATTYPSGGLHARYFNDLDLASDAQRLAKIHSPPRTLGYTGSGTSQYVDVQDARINAQANPQPGALTSNWSAIWFGSIWLKLSAGSYTFQITLPATANNCAVRAWIGKTQFGTQLVDQWAFTNTSGGVYTFTVSASALAGSSSYGAGLVQRDGWYPIKLEYAIDGTVAAAPALKLTSSPAAYTDPGGTAIASGSQSTVVPATSLSPLGCVDQRYQGIAHFDLAQQTIQAYGYQAAVEPYQLETLNAANPAGVFPGVLAPRLREGHDTDVILTPDLGPGQDGEGILNYSSTADATDEAASLQGNGAGVQTGTTGQLQSKVYDPVTLAGSLFDLQQWQDFSDAAFGALLNALLSTQLSLQLQPWQLLSADPVGRPRQAYTWPLPGTLQQMRWRPGDGLRIQARQVNIWDTAPRQMLTVVRNALPHGTAATQASFADRPLTEAQVIKKLLYSASRPQRNYQRSLSTLLGSLQDSISLTHGTTGPTSLVSLQQGDTVVRAQLRIYYNSGGVGMNVLVNGTDETTVLNGPWTGVPVLLDLTSVAQVDANNNLRVQVKNNSATLSSTISYQLSVQVLR